MFKETHTALDEKLALLHICLTVAFVVFLFLLLFDQLFSISSVMPLVVVRTTFILMSFIFFGLVATLPFGIIYLLRGLRAMVTSSQHNYPLKTSIHLIGSLLAVGSLLWIAMNINID